MNKRVALLLYIFMLGVLFLVGCQPADQALIPVTGEEFSPAPAQVMLARDHVLDYINSSSRLPDVPPSMAWQLNNEKKLEGKYYFYSGDWLMIIWIAGIEDDNQQVIVHNKATDLFWCGYVQSNGYVKDTSYTR